MDPSLALVWAGQVVNVIIGDASGGGYDALARLVSRHLGKHLPGNPNVVPQNMPGATHKIATNFLYAVPPDGLTIAFVDRTMPTFQLRAKGPEAMQLMTLAEEPFTWAWPVLAPPSMEPRLAAGMRAALLRTLADPELLAQA